MLRTLLVVLATATASTGCFTYRADPAPVPGPTRVRVRFSPPRPFDIAIAGRDTLRLADVTELEGRVLAVRGDTLRLAVRDARTAMGAAAPGLGTTDATTLVPLGAGRVVEVRRLDAGRTALVVLAGVGIGVAALLVAAIVAVASVGY
jgi:hypothetical protein